MSASTEERWKIPQMEKLHSGYRRKDRQRSGLDLLVHRSTPSDIHPQKDHVILFAHCTCAALRFLLPFLPPLLKTSGQGGGGARERPVMRVCPLVCRACFRARRAALAPPSWRQRRRQQQQQQPEPLKQAQLTKQAPRRRPLLIPSFSAGRLEPSRLAGASPA